MFGSSGLLYSIPRVGPRGILLTVRTTELDHKAGWTLKSWCFQTVVLEKTLESPLDGKEIQPVNQKGNQFWIFIGRTEAETESPVLWPPDVKCRLIGKDPDAGKDWRQEEKGMTEDDWMAEMGTTEMVGWHHRLNGHESEQTWGDGDGQGSLVCCSPWGHNESDMTEWLNWTELAAKINIDLFLLLWFWRPAVCKMDSNLLKSRCWLRHTLSRCSREESISVSFSASSG